MRKYQQLALLIISGICVSLLLFYRHEYLRLRNVLSVLNFFGSINSANSSCVDFNVDLRKSITERYKYAEPRSVWSKLDNHFLYSTFWEDTEKGGRARTLTVGPKASFFDYGCRIWFEEGDSIVSKHGIFTFDVDIRSKTKTLGVTSFKFVLKCAVDNKPVLGVPYGVLWSTSTNSSIFSPIFKFRKAEDKAVLCVLPDYYGTPKTNIIEFISYYNMLGIDDFIIYDSGIQHSIFPFLESTTGRDGILQSVTVLSWNFPLIDSKLEKQSLIDDCLSRTYNSAKIVGIVAWNEYIMPAKNINLHNVIPVKQLDGLINISFETWFCCVNRKDEQSLKALPTFLRKKSCTRGGKEDKMFVNVRPYTNTNKRKPYDLPSYVAAVRRYDSCDTLPAELDETLPVPEFYSQITSHKLVRLWKTHLNASSIFYQ